MNKCKCDAFFLNFANKTRLNIMLLLKEKPCDVKTITNSLNYEQSLVSHNLKRLLNCNFVFVKRDGKKNVYYLNKKFTSTILNIYEKNILQNYCKTCKLKEGIK